MKNVSNHPNPQFERKNITLLNGEWDCGFKKAKRGYKFGVSETDLILFRANLNYKINVPFCIESELSGIGYKNFVNAVWYKKTIHIKKTENKLFLHIGAADYKTSLYVNNEFVGSHVGGYTSFSFDISRYIVDGENELFIVCEDDTRNPLIPSGKQSEKKNSYQCSYTRTTGIWQSVYLEEVPENYIKNFKIYPDEKQGLVTIAFNLEGKETLKCLVKYKNKTVGEKIAKNTAGNIILQIPLSEIHLWEVGQGRLYDLEFSFGDDNVQSYFGLRSVRLDGFKFLINEKSVFQRLVLDQGYYPKGIYTAQNDEELIKDIMLSISSGFNGARLHQKVFDPRFLYFCDKMGYIVWGEYANWGIDYSSPRAVAIFQNEWEEALNRDFNHPAIVGWCPFNETWNYKGRKQYEPLIKTIYEFTKSVDCTRPCIDTSGNFHVRTDIYDVHDYRCNIEEFKASFDRLVSDNELYEHVLMDNPGRQKYNGEPTFVSEYGGIKWTSDKEYKSWGYGKDVKTEAEFAQRYCGLTKALIDNEKMFGFCYTQLYDVEQEQNGLYTYHRKKKFSDETYEKIKSTNLLKAEIEK